MTWRDWRWAETTPTVACSPCTSAETKRCGRAAGGRTRARAARTRCPGHALPAGAVRRHRRVLRRMCSAQIDATSLLCCACCAALRQGIKGKEAKFAVRERAALLSLLYRGVELAVARGSSGLGPTLLG